MNLVFLVVCVQVSELEPRRRRGGTVAVPSPSPLSGQHEVTGQSRLRALFASTRGLGLYWHDTLMLLMTPVTHSK
jgi:hypothetical protein